MSNDKAAATGYVDNRTYAVGLPVWVKVYDDGRVEWDIDRSETAEGIREDGLNTHQSDAGPASEAQIEADAVRVEEWLAAHQTT